MVKFKLRCYYLSLFKIKNIIRFMIICYNPNDLWIQVHDIELTVITTEGKSKVSNFINY